MTNPDAMRALAHPGRLAIFMRLSLDGPATATECAEVAGLSPSACSYHLRALAKWGFVEEAVGGSDGRERRWRATVGQLTVNQDPAAGAQDPEQTAAARLLIDQALQLSARAVADYLDNQADHDPAWQAAAMITERVLHTTPAELAELGRKFQALLAPYERGDPAQRPSDAERVLFAVQAVPWQGP